MASSETACEPVKFTKRRLDEADDCELDEFRKPKTVMRKYPPPKIRIGVEVVRDFPPSCGILLQGEMEKPFEDKNLSCKPKESGFNRPSVGKIIQEKKPLKNLDNVDSKSKSKSKSMECESHPFENNKLKRLIKPKELGTKINNKPFGSRFTGKVKHWDQTSENDENAHGSRARDSCYSVNSTIGLGNELTRREEIRDLMMLFDTVYNQLFQDNRLKQMGEKKKNWSLPAEAARIVKQKLNLMNVDKTLGQIRGIQPGDVFKFRSQLYLVGLHCQQHCGIDYTKIDGKNVAISIVDSGRYSNESQSWDVLTYYGQGGGGSSTRNVAPVDQKLERGNLALKNSMDEKNPVRVIRKVFGGRRKNNDVFVYDGFYTVKHCTQIRGSEGKMVFMFDLHKMPDQPRLHKRINGIPPGNVVSYQHSTFQML